MKFPGKSLMASHIKDWRIVITEGPLHVRLLFVLLGDWDKDHSHHENHQAYGEQGWSQDVGDLLALAGKVQAADDDATGQEASPGGHEVNGEPEDFTCFLWGVRGPEGLASRQSENCARCMARGCQLILGLGKCALSQGDVLWAAWHDLLGDSVEV
ncbi:hypothetical protein ILYODFUR_004094 [Ilyodon furcidens]|uniref:Uncharacterized protein n=1 Tax=Ilyodon furcidens TaxID=33524 RepID=A0ABV0TG22_9TELE